MSRITENSRSALRLLACGLVATAIVVQAAPAYALDVQSAPYQHDVGTAPTPPGPGTAPYHHDMGTAAVVRARESAPYQHDVGTAVASPNVGTAPYQHDVGTGEPSSPPATAAEPVSDEPGGFDWTMAGILLAALLGVITIAAAGGTAVRQSRRRVARD